MTKCAGEMFRTAVAGSKVMFLTFRGGEVSVERVKFRKTDQSVKGGVSPSRGAGTDKERNLVRRQTP